MDAPIKLCFLIACYHAGFICDCKRTTKILLQGTNTYTIIHKKKCKGKKAIKELLNEDTNNN